MKISYNWLKDHIALTESPEEIANLLTFSGLEVEHIELRGANPENLKQLVVGEVLECEKHPNADKLKITKVSIGKTESLSIVCGAPNVASGQKVIVATIGTMLYPTIGEPFKIKKSKIRGIDSEGMLCAEDEIGLGSSHDGLLLLPLDAKPGESVIPYLPTGHDAVFEIGLTPNRADAASHRGVARDLSALLKRNLKDHSVDLSDLKPTIDNPVKVHIDSDQNCLRYSGIYVKDIKVGASPDWLREKLQCIGLKSINNVVDITNYIMHDLGQPLHAFDADKLEDASLNVRKAQAGESFITLDKTERKLQGGELVIADSRRPVALAGVMGGLDSSVTDTTRNIFIESACFNSVEVRKSSRNHLIFTDSSFRFERGTDPNICAIAVTQAALHIKLMAGGQNSALLDLYPKPVLPFIFQLRFKRVYEVLGIEIPVTEIREILTRLEIKIISEDSLGMQVEVPPFKVDVTGEIDVIEEIIRIYGYHNIPIPASVHSSLSFNLQSKHKPRQLLKDFLARNGYNEIATNSLTKAAYALVPEKQVLVENALSQDLGVMRQSLIPGFLHAIQYNRNRHMPYMRIFETGNVYFSNEGKYIEQEHLCICITGTPEKNNWLENVKPATYFDIKSIVQNLLHYAGIAQTKSRRVENNEMDDCTELLISNKCLFRFGKIKKAITSVFDLDQDVYCAIADITLLIDNMQLNTRKVAAIPRFPAVRRDLSLIIDEQVSFESIELAARETEKNILKEIGVFDVFRNEKIGSGKKSYSLFLVLQHAEKTLEEAEIQKAMQSIQSAIEQKTGAKVR